MDTTIDWDKANNLVNQVVMHKNAEILHITITPSNSYNTGTFARDNWEYLSEYWNEFKTLADTDDEELMAVFVIRQFTKMKVADQNLPLKRVAAAALTPTEIVPISGEHFKEASSIDHKTRKPISVEPSVSYIDFIELVRLLDISIDY